MATRLLSGPVHWVMKAATIMGGLHGRPEDGDVVARMLAIRPCLVGCAPARGQLRPQSKRLRMKASTTHVAIASTLILCAAPASGRAEDLAIEMDANDAGAPSTSRTSLEEITVTAQRLEILGTAATASEGLVTDQELQLTPQYRPGQLLETVPGLIVTLHSGEGKANQYLMRGYNLDHGTDLETYVIANARAFLKRDSLATYCDRVLLPAHHLAQLDGQLGTSTENQQIKIRRVIVDVLTAVGSDSLKISRRRYRGSVLQDVSAARWLRQERERSSGRWQGPLGVPPKSVVICLGLGSSADDLAAELLVRMLRTQSIDARHFSPGDINVGLPPGAEPNGVSIVYLVSAFPGSERDCADSLIKRVHEILPRAYLVRVFCPGVTAPSESGNSADNTEPTVNSLGQAIEICMSWQAMRSKRDASPGSQLADVVRANRESGAAEQCQTGTPTLWHAALFDWLSQKIESRR